MLTIKINDFRGVLTDISAEKEALQGAPHLVGGYMKGSFFRGGTRLEESIDNFEEVLHHYILPQIIISFHQLPPPLHQRTCFQNENVIFVGFVGYSDPISIMC